MSKRKKPEPKPEKEPADITVDKSEALARAQAEAPVGWAIHPGGTRAAATAALAEVLGVCPICGTAKHGNRCEVCGHQEHDT